MQLSFIMQLLQLYNDTNYIDSTLSWLAKRTSRSDLFEVICFVRYGSGAEVRPNTSNVSYPAQSRHF